MTKLIEWNPAAEEEFSKFKTYLANAVLLIYSSDNRPTCVMVDASDGAIGGVIHQKNHDCWVPLSFLSSVAKKFRHMLEGRHFIIFVMHNML